MANSRVLVIGDIHFPFNHPDAISFLKEINVYFRPDKVISIGDELDYHSISFHEHNPDLLSPSDELETAISRLEKLYDIFPEVDVLDSNHGSLVYRKGVFHGLPRSVFKSYNEILRAPKGWRWHFDLVIKLSNGQDCYFHHGKTSNHLALSKSMGMNAIQGHHHNQFAINYWASPVGVFWQAFTGCLVDDKSLAMAYNKTNLARPVIGSLMIIDGHPRLIPMVMDKHGRWIGSLV